MTQTLSVVFESSWEAKPDFFTPFQIHLFKGRIIIYGTGETQKEILYKNEALIKVINSMNGNDFLDWIEKNSKKE